MPRVRQRSQFVFVDDGILAFARPSEMCSDDRIAAGPGSRVVLDERVVQQSCFLCLARVGTG